jgi:DNA primase
VPFIDNFGNVIGFTARVLDKSEPKYLNTSDTLLFNKSRFVFGLYQAKEAIRKNGFVVIVEGNMDVISSHQAGVCEAVATSGTAMTEQHLKILSGLTSDIRLAYDGDDAGVRAAERAIEMAGDLGLDLSVISNYHGAKDPDELIQKDPELWRQAVEERVPAIDWLLSKYEEKVDLESGPGKRKYSDVALKLLDKITDEVERAGYEKKVAEKLGVEVEDLRKKGKRLEEKLEKSKNRKIYKNAKTEVKSDRLKQLTESLLAIKVYGGVKTKIPFEVPDDETRLMELEMVFNHEHEGMEPDNSELEEEAEELLGRYDAELKKERKAELNARLAEVDEDSTEYEEILKELQTLQKS